MTRVTIDIPQGIDPLDAKMLMVGKLFDDGLVSSGRAAKMIGISREKFLLTIGKYGFSSIQTTPEELSQEVANIRKDLGL